MKGEKLFVDWYNNEFESESGSELTIQEFESNLPIESDSSIIPKYEKSKDDSPAIFTFESETNGLSSDIQKDIQNFINASNNIISNSSIDTSNTIIDNSQNENIQAKSTNFFFDSSSSLSEKEKEDINNLQSNQLSENSSSNNSENQKNENEEPKPSQQNIENKPENSNLNQLSESSSSSTEMNKDEQKITTKNKSELIDEPKKSESEKIDEPKNQIQVNRMNQRNQNQNQIN